MLQDSPIPTHGMQQPAQARFVIQTERLTLRRPTIADVPAIAALANDIRIAQMTRRLPFPCSIDHAMEFVTSLATQSPQSGDAAYLIEHLHTPVGIVGIDWSNAISPELGYWLGCDHWGRGFATEVARAAMARLEDIRREAAIRMGLATSVDNVPQTCRQRSAAAPASPPMAVAACEGSADLSPPMPRVANAKQSLTLDCSIAARPIAQSSLLQLVKDHR